jgi:hypothetical protein
VDAIGHQDLTFAGRILFRLTKSCFKSMRYLGRRLEESDFTKAHRLSWVPPAIDRSINRDLFSADANLDEGERDNRDTL